MMSVYGTILCPHYKNMFSESHCNVSIVIVSSDFFRSALGTGYQYVTAYSTARFVSSSEAQKHSFPLYPVSVCTYNCPLTTHQVVLNFYLCSSTITWRTAEERLVLVGSLSLHRMPQSVLSASPVCVCVGGGVFRYKVSISV